MKRKGNFYKDICNKENIKKAIIEAAKGKKIEIMWQGL